MAQHSITKASTKTAPTGGQVSNSLTARPRLYQNSDSSLDTIISVSPCTDAINLSD